MQEIRKNCNDKNFHRAYLICGDEAFLRLQAQKMLLEALGAEEGSMNFLTFEGAKTEPAAVIDACETLPFFADYRVVLVSDSGWFAKSCEEMADYLPTIPETTVLIFNERTADKRVKSYKAMAKTGHIAECVMPQEPELVRWVGGILKENGWSMKREAWPLFYERAGADMSRMKNKNARGGSMIHEKRKSSEPYFLRAVCRCDRRAGPGANSFAGAGAHFSGHLWRHAQRPAAGLALRHAGRGGLCAAWRSGHPGVRGL